jgi:hypothetical protein
MKQRLLSLVFVLAGAVCLMARQSRAAGPAAPLVVCGIGLLLVGIVLRLTARRS